MWVVTDRGRLLTFLINRPVAPECLLQASDTKAGSYDSRSNKARNTETRREKPVRRRSYKAGGEWSRGWSPGRTRSGQLPPA